MANVKCKFEDFYSPAQHRLIENEFKRLKDNYYLEHAGATLYSEQQLSDVLSELSSNIFANPHARNLSSKLTEDVIDQVRYEILNHFGTNSDEYSVIFTSGATAALKLVAESFIYESDNCDGQTGAFVYLEDNHTSVLGMRQYASNVTVIRHNEAIDLFSKDIKNSECTSSSNSLFVFPAQCNFAGTKFPLTWIKKVQNGALNGFKKNFSSLNWFVVLDAASYASTNVLDLSEYKPDFVPLSFYKMFGYPTGVGALLVKNSSIPVLQKKYFGGGTVLMALSTENVMIPRPTLHERFEDGTVPFLSIISLRQGFRTLKRLNLNMDIISKHTFSLARYIYHSLYALHHYNGKPAAILYHDTDFNDIRFQGGIINFNLLRSSGDYVGYSEVLQFANLYGLHLRTGCFCNPGACQRHLALSTADVKYHFEQGHICGDQKDLIDGYPTGSVRISFGYMSTYDDACMFLKMVVDCFLDKPVIHQIRRSEVKSNLLKHANTCLDKNEADLKIRHHNYTNNLNYNIPTNIEETQIKSPQNKTVTSDTSTHQGYLEKILLYPIKSCAAFSVHSKWELVSTGLKYDRQWMVVNSAGVCITQKQDTRLCLIKPEIDLENDKLHLHFEGCSSISVDLSNKINDKIFIRPCQSKVCSDRILGWDCGNEVSEWLSDILGYAGVRLLRQCSDDQSLVSRVSKKGERLHLSLANQAQFLLVNTSSVQWLLNKIPSNSFDDTLQDTIDRFRPNFVVRFSEPFIEKTIKILQVGKNIFNYDKPCTRCQMICINQTTGDKTLEPLKTLSLEMGGKISFGVYLQQDEELMERFIEKGSKVEAK